MELTETPINAESFKILMRAFFPTCRFCDKPEYKSIILGCDDVNAFKEILCVVDGKRYSAYIYNITKKQNAVVYLWDYDFFTNYYSKWTVLDRNNNIAIVPNNRYPFSIACFTTEALATVIGDHAKRWLAYKKHDIQLF